MSEEREQSPSGRSDDPIVGAVARILNTRELVINRGLEHGVRRGMYFQVLAPEGENIRDPETGENLGSVERPKVSVQVIEAKDRLSVARTHRRFTRNLGGVGMGSFGRIFDAPNYVEEYETLKTTSDTWENLSPRESYVSVGDPVREVAKELVD